MTDQADDFDRIYQGCFDLPPIAAMTAIVEAHSGLVPEHTTTWRGDGQVRERHLHNEVLSQFDALCESLRHQYDALLGPPLSFTGAPDIPLGTIVVTSVNLDRCGDSDKLQLTCDHREWDESPLFRAARHYQRECGWDFAPDLDGRWLVCLLPTGAAGTGTRMFYTSNLVGFAILYDRDEDGAYESLGHLWTAKGVRRKGLARRLLDEARRQCLVRIVEGPLTDAGEAAIDAVWPELRAQAPAVTPREHHKAAP